jgi:amino acid transporter
VTRGVFVVETITIAKLVPLVVLVVSGIWLINPDYLRWSDVPAAAAVGRTAMVLIFAFVGLEVALVPSGELRDPARTVPRALFSALAITTTLYLLIQAVAQGLLGPSMASFAAAPLAEAAGRVLGRGGRLLVLAGASVSMFGHVSGRHARQSPHAVCVRARRRAAACAGAHSSALPYAARGHHRLRGGGRGRVDQQQLHAAGHSRECRGADAVPDVRGGVVRAAAP